MLLAEQIVIACPPRALEDLLRHRPVDWAAPLLRLAGDEGEAAGLAVLGERPESPGRRQHRLELTDPTADGRAFRAGLVWRTADYRVLFSEFAGTIEVRTLESQSVLAIQGQASAPPDAATAPASRRAAEGAVRSLLGHLRAAMEAGPNMVRPVGLGNTTR